MNNNTHYQIVGGIGLHKLDHIHDLVEELWHDGISMFEQKGMMPIGLDDPSTTSAMTGFVNYTKRNQMAQELYKEFRDNKKYRRLYKITMLRVLERVPSYVFQKYPGYLGYIELPANRVHRGRSCVKTHPIRECKIRLDMLHCRYGWLRLDHETLPVPIQSIAISRIEPGRWDAVILQ